MQQSTSRNGIRLVSALPRRQRWEVAALVGNSDLAAPLQASLLALPEIDSCQVNPATGRFLVLGSASEAQIRAAVEAVQKPSPISVVGQLPQKLNWSNLVGATLAGVGLVVAPEVTVLAVVAGSAYAALKSRRRRAKASKATRMPTKSKASLLAGLTLAAAGLALAPEITAVAALAATVWATVKRGRRRRLEVTAPKLQVASKPQHPLARLLRYRKEYRPHVARAAFLTVTTKVLDLTPPMIIALGIDAVSGGPIMAALGLPIAGQFLSLAALSVVIWGIESFCEFRFRVEWEGFANRLQHDMRLDAYNHVQALDLATLQNLSTGELVKVLNADVNQIERFFSQGISEMMTIATNATAATLGVLAVAPQMAPFPLLPIPFVIWFSLKYERHLAHRMDAVQEAADRVNALLVNNIVGMPTIRSYTAEEIETRHLSRLSQEFVELSASTTRKTASYNPVIRLALLFGFTGTIVMGGYLVQQGMLTTGAFAFVMLVTQRVLWPLTMLNNIIANYERTMVGARRIFRVLELPRGPSGGQRALPLSRMRGEIAFERVSFSYDGSTPILEDFSLKIPAGKLTAIVGHTGTGKTTLTRLLLHFFRCQAGRILIDGQDIGEFRTEQLRRAIGLVSQSSFLFDGTVADNIRYGRPGATAEEVAEAARSAEAHDFIEKLPLGYDTPVGDRLSAGQGQRLCLARAILKDPPILILDEATSFVDNETEAAIRRSLERISPGRTTLIIAHRLSTVCFADNIVVLGKGGQILERGNHQELLRRQGHYAHLWRVQTGASEGP